MKSTARAFVLHQTRLRPVPGLVEIRLHLADDVLALWHASQLETGDPEAPLPYWGFAWAGGLALAHYLADHPEVAAGRRVLDIAAGSGICAIAAIRAGATTAVGVDVDPFAAAAIRLNARANGVRIGVVRRDVLDEPPPDVDLILAGDWGYDARLAERVLTWLQRARRAGVEILVGDPGRRYLPLDALEPIATYAVRTTTELEDLAIKGARVFTMRADPS